MKNYLILIRPYGMLFLGFTPVYGAIANGEFKFLHLMILLLIGLLTHIFSFVQNDYYDVNIDSKSKYVSKRPLVTESISQKTALFIFLFSFIICLLLAIFFFFTYYSFILLLLTFFLFTLYNKYSKRFTGLEYILCTGVFSFGVFGALTVSNNISYFVILISAFAFFQWLFNVGVLANLKDIEFDSKHGIRTTPMVYGVHVSNKKLVIPLLFSLYAFSIKIAHILFALSPILLGYSSFFVYKFPIPGICFLILSILVLYLTYKILTTPLKKRNKMLVFVGFQEGFAFLLLPIALMSYLLENIGLFPTVLIILLLIFWPLFWFRVLFGKKMIPLE